MDKFLICILGAVGAFALQAADGDVLATTPSAAVFAFNTSDASPFALTSTAAATAVFAEMPVTWRAGETVTEEEPDGTTTTVSTASTGSYAFSPKSNGVWILKNSEGGKVYVSIPWTEAVGSICTSGVSPFAVDTKEPGPDRKSYKREILPIAYSGDGWQRNRSAASILTFTSPDGAVSERPFKGSGVEVFNLRESGSWTLSLAMDNGTTLAGVLTLIGPGFVVSFH